jgi:hypothetical protein
VAAPIASSKRRAAVALLLGIAGVLVLPAAIEVARRSKAVGILDASYAIPLAFLCGLTSVVMARRARRNLQWHRLRDGGTGMARAAVLVGGLALYLSVAAALPVGFYELFVIYQHSR